MNATVNTHGNEALVEVAGKLTVQISSDLEALFMQLPHEVCDIDIDVSGVTYVSSAGLRVIADADRLAAARGGTMRLLHPNARVLELLELTGLYDVLAIEL